MHEDGGVTAVELVEDRIERFIAQVCAMGVGEEDYAIAIEVVEGMHDFKEAAFDVGRR